MTDKLWEQLDLTDINRLVEKMLYHSDKNFSDVVQDLMKGDFEAAFSQIKDVFVNTCLPGIAESKSLFVGVLFLGLFSMLLHYAFGMVKSRQVSELAFYFVYLLAILLLLDSFEEMFQVGTGMLDECREFISVLAPAYCLSISLSTGSISAAANYQFTILLLMGTDYILAGFLLPLTRSYVFLAIMDGLDEKHRMKEFMKLMDKVVSWGIKLCLTVTVMLSGVQNLVSAQVDGVQKTVVQKTIAAIPGIGDMSESVTEVVMGSAGLIKNSIGAAAMVCMCLLILRPMWEVFCISMTMKIASACIRMMGPNTLSDTVSRVGDAGIQVMKIIMCATLVFFISIAMTMLVMKGGMG